VLVAFVAAVVVATEVVVVVVRTSSGDVTQSEINTRFVKRGGCEAGRLEMLSRRAVGAFHDVLIVADV